MGVSVQTLTVYSCDACDKDFPSTSAEPKDRPVDGVFGTVDIMDGDVAVPVAWFAHNARCVKTAVANVIERGLAEDAVAKTAATA